jgi:hypothetical protein
MKAICFETKEGKLRGGSEALPAASSVQHPSLPHNQTLQFKRHGRSGCGLVDAVSVSGRVNALINPKSEGFQEHARQTQALFVLHCLCFIVTATTYIRKTENGEREQMKHGG